MEIKEKDQSKLISQIDSAFSDVTAPASSETFLTQEDFESFYMDDGFEHIRQHLYDYEDDEVHYLTPFLMRSYLRHYRGNDLIDFNLSLYLFWFAGFKSEVDFIRDRYLSVYRRFNSEQRKSICVFLSFIVEFKMDEGYIENDVIRFWCEDIGAGEEVGGHLRFQ